ncbi:MAG: hypothetical protein ICV78_05315 [Tolypothrix sp. Co-bin9]|nr:hypothetical protein [Tolypothrix sp. Co-bin9]
MATPFKGVDLTILQRLYIIDGSEAHPLNRYVPFSILDEEKIRNRLICIVLV